MSKLQDIATTVAALDESLRLGLDYDFQPLPTEAGGEEVMQVNIQDREELPVFMTMPEDQLLCICYLWDEAQVKTEAREKMLEAMIDLNIPMPLSSFGRIGDRYAIFGAMSVESSAEDVALELATLSDNAIEAIESLSEFLV